MDIPEIAGNNVSNSSQRQLVFRKASTADLPTIREIESSSFPADVAWDADILRQTIHECDVWLAECDGRPAGYTSFVDHSDHLYLENIAVLPAYRNRGIGAEMLGFVNRVAKSGKVRLEVDATDSRALKFYEKAGFRPIGAIANYYSEGRHAFSLELSVSAAAVGILKTES